MISCIKRHASALRFTQATYTMRRDWMCDAFAANFELAPTSDVALFSGGAAPGYVAYSRSKTSSVAGKEGFSEKGSKKALLSFVPPTVSVCQGKQLLFFLLSPSTRLRCILWFCFCLTVGNVCMAP